MTIERRRRVQAGLTLLEVLVTVTIFAMLFAVLSLGWHQAMNAQVKLSTAAERAGQHQQLALMLRQLIGEALLPDPEAGIEFTGDDKGFQAESTTSLLNSVGSAPMAVSVKLETTGNDRRLQISHGDAPSRTLPWQFSQARWRYLDQGGDWHDTWPPRSPSAEGLAPLERDDYLPALVAFTYTLVGETRGHEVLSSPRASSWRLSEPTSPFSGLGGS